MIKSGQLLCVEDGEYSDYGVVGFFEVLRDFDPMEILEGYLLKYPNQNRTGFKGAKFLEYLLDNKFLSEVNYSRLHLGDDMSTNVAFYGGALSD